MTVNFIRDLVDNHQYAAHFYTTSYPPHFKPARSPCFETSQPQYFEKRKDASHQGLRKDLPLTIRFSIPFNVQVCRSFPLTVKSISRSFPSAYESVFSHFETPCLPSSTPFPSPYTPSGGYSHDNPQPRSLPLTRPLEEGYRNVSIQHASRLSLSSERHFLKPPQPVSRHPSAPPDSHGPTCSSSFRAAVVHAVETRRSTLMVI